MDRVSGDAGSHPSDIVVADLEQALSGGDLLGGSPFLGALLQHKSAWCLDRWVHGNLIITHPGAEKADLLLEGILANALSTLEPGRVRILMIDPRNLGETFRSFRAFGDTNRDRIFGSVGKTREDIRSKMNQAVQWVGRVIETSLKDQHDHVDDHNAQPDAVVQPYALLCIAGFPENFDQTACEDLERVMIKGPKCGVHVIMTWDRSRALPHGVQGSKFEATASLVEIGSDGSIVGHARANAGLRQPAFDPRPDADALRGLVQQAGRRADDTAQTVLPLKASMDRVLQGRADLGQRASRLVAPDGVWSASSAKGLVVPLGQSGSSAMHPMILGERDGIAHHAIIVGAPGTGKSNLLRVMVSSLGLLYSPEEVELYLLDFKDGVSFKPFSDHKLPHVRVVGLSSDPELGRIVLQAAVDAMTERNDMMTRVEEGIDNIEDYRASVDQEGRYRKMPRIVMILDEFQTMFAPGRDGQDLQRANLRLLDELVRKGRSTGIHLILATQSLIGAGVEQFRETLSQVGVRMLLRCSERDSEMLLGSGNTEAARLSRGGEMLYNDAYGEAGQSVKLKGALMDPQQWLPEASKRLRTLASVRNMQRQPIVFRGTDPSDLRDVITPMAESSGPVRARAATLDLVIGLPLSLKPRQSIRLTRQGGQNVLIVDRRSDLVTGCLAGILLSGLAARSAADLSIGIHDRSEQEAMTGIGIQLSTVLPGQVEISGTDNDMPEATFTSQLEDLLDRTLKRIEAAERQAPGDRKTFILVLTGLQRMRALRADAARERGSRGSGSYSLTDNPAPSRSPLSILTDILRRGPEVAVHTVIHADSPGNLEATIDRTLLREFSWRICGPMSDSEATLLVQDGRIPLGTPNRAVLFDEGSTPRQTIFRPFGPPSSDWAAQFIGTLHSSWGTIA
jgi:hypothetical protein